MATVVPAKRPSSFLDFALQITGLKQRRELAEKEFDLKEAEQEIRREGLSLEERRTLLSESRAAIVNESIEAQTDRMVGQEARDAEIRSLGLDIDRLKALGMKDTADAKEAQIKTAFLESLSPDEYKTMMTSKMLIDQLRAQQHHQRMILDEARLRQDQLEFSVQNERLRQTSEYNQFEQQYGGQINALERDQNVHAPQVDAAARALFKASRDPKATPESLAPLQKIYSDALGASQQWAEKRALMRDKEKSQLEIETKGRLELHNLPDAFVNVSEHRAYLVNPTSELELVESGIFSWIPGLGQRRLRLKGSKTPVPEDAKITPFDAKDMPSTTPTGSEQELQVLIDSLK